MALQVPACWPWGRGRPGPAVGDSRGSLAWLLIKLLIFAAVLVAAWSLFPAVAHAGVPGA